MATSEQHARWLARSQSRPLRLKIATGVFVVGMLGMAALNQLQVALPAPRPSIQLDQLGAKLPVGRNGGLATLRGGSRRLFDTQAPSSAPTISAAPSSAPTWAPTISAAPSSSPTSAPTISAAPPSAPTSSAPTISAAPTGASNVTVNTEDDDMGACPWLKSNKDTLPTCTTDDPKVCCGNGGYPADDDSADDEGNTASGAGLLILSLALMFYMFLGIAILCDELFVPALEIIADKWQLSNDIAGATLMAAGGSAPELFTSLFGAFGRSEVGFSTIVGSAVFNVLFVIGMCAMFTPAKFCPLQLTWWPLARDCTYYIITLIFLVIWMQDGKVELYEAIIQLMLYFGYVFLMAKSEKLEATVKGWIAKRAAGGKVAQSPREGGAEQPKSTHITDAVVDARWDLGGKQAGRPSTFRASVLQMMTSKDSTVEATGVALVTRIKGDVNEVFDKLDENSNGELDKAELKELLEALGTEASHLTPDEIQKMLLQITDGEGTDVITKAQFTTWYAKSEARLTTEMRTCFNKIDTNKSDTIDKDEIRGLLAMLGHSCSDEEVEEVESQIAHHPETGQITWPDFRDWYTKSLLFDQKREEVGDAVESIESMWSGLLGGFKELSDKDMPLRAKISFILTVPLTAACCLVPDCRPPGKEGWAYATFAGSIIGIGAFSYVMVEMAYNVGEILNIPVYIMGITIIAAGTSVPDLLSSVIVARQGHGDMAVSSSVGSNIFDVSVGIPLPWIMFSIFTEINGCQYGNRVNEGDLLLPTIILLAMVCIIVFAIAINQWQMTHALGYIMFMCYVCYLLFAILQEYCFHISLSL